MNKDKQIIKVLKEIITYLGSVTEYSYYREKKLNEIFDMVQEIEVQE